MSNFFKKVYEVLSHKYFRILLCVLIVVLIFGVHFDKKILDNNRKKVDNVIVEIKKNKIKSVAPENNVIIIKKEIVPENVDELELKSKKAIDGEVKKFAKLSNVFLKMKELEDEYVKRVKEKKINYKRVVKYGDFVYYSQSIIFKDTRMADVSDKKSNLFVFIKQGDFISEKLIGKKVGGKVKYNYFDLLNSLEGEGRRNVEMYLNSEVGVGGEKKTVREIMVSTGLEYELTVLDFVPKQLVEKLELLNEN
jgi:hypothetical protein